MLPQFEINKVEDDSIQIKANHFLDEKFIGKDGKCTSQGEFTVKVNQDLYG